MYSILGAIAGFFLLGRSFLGAVLGFVVGSIIDGINARGKGDANKDVFTYYREQSSITREDFPTMLMALSASVMRADGKTLKVELDFIKSFFSRQFGPQFTAGHLKVLKHFLDGGEIPLEQICEDIRFRTQVEVRIQLLHYLFGIARADGHVAAEEINVLSRIANLLEIPAGDFNSLKNMFYRDVNSDYKVLGIESTASEEEIKKAYRQMAVRYHPDKVSQMGEEFQVGAKEKFQKVQEAYENIKKARGIA